MRPYNGTFDILITVNDFPQILKYRLPPTMEPILAPLVPCGPIDAPYGLIRAPFSPSWDLVGPEGVDRGP